jgi:flagellar hook-associated protein 3 FlgL
MTVTSIGDMAQQFMSLRATNTIKSDLAQLSAGLASGRAPDLVQQLGGDTSRLTGLNHSLSKLDGFLQVSRETIQVLDGMQAALQRIDNTRDQLTNQLLLVTDGSTQTQVRQAGDTALGALTTVISALNTRVADRALFGGRAVESTPLVSADVMMADLQAQIGADRTFSGIRAAVDAWFDDPAGGFTTIAYQGAAGPDLERKVSEDRNVILAARADDQAVRDMLRGNVLAALTTTLPNLDAATKVDLLKSSGQILFGAATGLVAIQSRLGTAEEIAAETQAEKIAQKNSLQIAVNDLVSIDPFETAVKLQNVQLQLETNYSVISRLSQLSLLRFI